MKKNPFKTHWIFFILLGIGLFFRYWNIDGWYPFDYDQEIAAWEVKKILSGDFTLIGQEMSVGGFYLGPLLHYIYAPFFALFRLDPRAGVFPLALQMIASSFLLYKLGQKWFGERVALIAVFLYVLNPQIVSYDRALNPTAFVPLLSLGFLHGMDRLFDGKRWALWLLGLILGLTFHINPSTLFFFFVFLVMLLIFRKDIRAKIRDWMIWGGIIVVIASPLILFELRNHILISNILRLMSEKGEEGMTLLRFYSMNEISFSLARGFLFPWTFQWLTWVIAVSIITSIVFWWRKTKRRSLIFLAMFFILTPILLFTFYNGNVPEYYFAPTIPLYALLLGFLITKNIRTWPLIFVICGILAFLHAPRLYGLLAGTHRNLYYKRAAVHAIVEYAAGRSFSISYITDLGLKTGYPFLFYIEGNEPRKEIRPPVYTILDPYYILPPDQKHYDKVFGGIGVKYSEKNQK